MSIDVSEYVNRWQELRRYVPHTQEPRRFAPNVILALACLNVGMWSTLLVRLIVG